MSERMSSQPVYEPPVADVLHVESEGLLCASGQHEEWNEETLE